MFATVIVVLPSAYTGGQVCVCRMPLPHKRWTLRYPLLFQHPCLHGILTLPMKSSLLQRDVVSLFYTTLSADRLVPPDHLSQT